MAGMGITTLMTVGLGIGAVYAANRLTYAETPTPPPPGTPSFQVFIPRKVAQGHTPTNAEFPNIGTVKAVVGMTSGNPVTFTITDPSGVSLAFPALTPGGTQQSVSFPSGDTVYATPNTDPNDPSRYELDFILRSGSALNCTGTQSGNPSVYTVAVGATDPQIIGVCLDSYDGRYRSVPINSCTNAALGTNLIPVPLDDPADKVASLDPANQPTLGCFTQRPPVDVAVVLDKSGSMADSINGGPPTQPQDAKIWHLRNAVNDFVSVWNANSVATDNVAIALFDHDPSWWTQGTVDFSTTHFQSITSVAAGVQSNITTTCQLNPNPGCTLISGTSTSIGGGLFLADRNLPSDGNRHVILLMSDGMQNTDPEIEVTATSQVRLYCENAMSPPCATTPFTGCTLANAATTPACALPNPAKIYALTVGNTPAVNEAVNQAIANNSGGFYINTETNAALIRPFFLELLQNFIKFNSYETVRMISEPTPYSAMVPISSTSHEVVFSLMWAPGQGLLRLTITPPGGVNPIVQQSASGFISFAQLLPLAAPFDPRADWKIQVDGAATQNAIPFDLHIMTEDGAIRSDLAIVPGDYKAGDKIRLRAKLTDFGAPILGLGSHPGDKIMAESVKPGNSIGDILSDSAASGVASGAPDPQSAAENKLANTLQRDPSVLKHDSDTVQLFDDGKPEHGDDVAGDGIYSALYPATLPGHYNFLFAVETRDPNGVSFSRQQLRTAFVRSVPDADNTVFLTSIVRREKRQLFSILMTPRFKAGPGCPASDPKCGRMGPGWANYFWFTTSRLAPIKPTDNLDGTYTANVPFTGSKLPKVSVHFENVIAIIGDPVTASQLPQPLDSGNVLVDDVPHPMNFAIFFDGGAGIPQGTFSTAVNTGFSLNAGLEYMFNPHFSAEGIFGYHHFPAKIGSSLNIYQFSGDAKVYLNAPPKKVRPFVNFGPGGYKFSPGSANFGGNLGGGLLFELNPRVGIQGSYNFHVVNTAGGATKFSAIQGGLRFVL